MTDIRTVDEELVGMPAALLHRMSLAGLSLVLTDERGAKAISDGMALIEQLHKEVERQREALENIAGAPLYRTRTDNSRVCLAEQTRDIARAALTGEHNG